MGALAWPWELSRSTTRHSSPSSPTRGFVRHRSAPAHRLVLERFLSLLLLIFFPPHPVTETGTAPPYANSNQPKIHLPANLLRRTKRGIKGKVNAVPYYHGATSCRSGSQHPAVSCMRMEWKVWEPAPKPKSDAGWKGPHRMTLAPSKVTERF